MKLVVQVSLVQKLYLQDIKRYTQQQLQSAYNPDDDFSGKLKKKFKDIRKKDGFDSVEEENMEEKLTRGQQSKLDDLEAYLGHLQKVSMTLHAERR